MSGGKGKGEEEKRRDEEGKTRRVDTGGRE